MSDFDYKNKPGVPKRIGNMTIIEVVVTALVWAVLIGACASLVRWIFS